MMSLASADWSAAAAPRAVSIRAPRTTRRTGFITHLISSNYTRPLVQKTNVVRGPGSTLTTVGLPAWCLRPPTTFAAKETDMENVISDLLKRYETGGLTRRDL